MTEVFFSAAALIIGYFLGAIPFAVIVAKRYGVNILTAGSGNPGATNVKRTCGKFAGNLVFILDMLKGFVAAFWPWLLMGALEPTDPAAVQNWPHAIAVAQLCGFAGALLGHCFSIFLKFKGGKGVSTTSRRNADCRARRHCRLARGLFPDAYRRCRFDGFRAFVAADFDDFGEIFPLARLYDDSRRLLPRDCGFHHHHASFEHCSFDARRRKFV